MSNVRQCPFDPLHIISAKSFAIHLVKCKRQHPEIKLVECYFDSSHLVKEEELKQHMRTCSGRNHLLEYKTTIDRTTTGCGADRLEDPAANLIYNTDESNRQKTETGGRSLQDDTECWDDFAYEAYDPLANCKSKMQNSKTFILPNPNKFAGQMKAAAATLAETHQVDVQDAEEASCEEGSLEDNAASSEHAERKYDPPGHEVSRTRHRNVKESPSDYDDAASNGMRLRMKRVTDPNQKGVPIVPVIGHDQIVQVVAIERATFTMDITTVTPIADRMMLLVAVEMTVGRGTK
uniref:CHHC U11-48K-type domain-containing protein n=1 Tax=Anopheles stephensi TaxID=30069 RepID=A0A182YDI2_ANOST